eukprot:TRINITY_DN512_c0_g7_i1.p1 TRINITY_DN512_c0_g7~~TRINITY_DN512_c0_g7_i1.p1  ORF type:complete len:361 (+),score=35.62 TRINITY_DN512_c0_g7_i1:247-1329(+)
MKHTFNAIDWWYKEFSYAKFSEDFWRVKLIQHTLLLASVMFFILSLINMVAFSNIWLMFVDGLGFLISLFTYLIFRKSGNVTATAWAISISVTAIVLLFLISVGGRSYSLAWATVILPFTFFLVGRGGGTVLSVITLSVCIYLVHKQISSGVPMPLSTGAFLNVVEVAIVQLLLFRFYEGTRQKAFDQVKAEHIASKRLSETDYLTDVYNRAKFLSLVKSLLANNNASNHCLVILDIDDFKEVNDNYGHNVGDEVLIAFARTLRSRTREEDIVARWGGEEFVLLLKNASPTEAKSCITHLLNAVGEIQPQNEPSLDNKVSFSAGITQCNRTTSIDETIRVADEALYQAKRNGKAQVVCVK